LQSLFLVKKKKKKISKRCFGQISNTIIYRPTFQFYKGGNKVAEMKGANPQQLEHYVKQHSGGEGSSGTSTSTKKSVGVEIPA
jgi:hypothetical protein